MSRNHLSPPVFPFARAVAWGEDRYGLWQALLFQGMECRFRWLMPGEFIMGSHKEKGRYGNEDQHPVKLTKGFWLGETTVTQALWQAVTGENPSRFEGEDRPVENVSWKMVMEFINRINQSHLEPQVRLPWEAEWEYGCRAGTETPFSFGESDELNLERVNYRGTWQYKSDEWGSGARRETAPVRSYPCNGWGLYEMHGNVWEWCADVWQEHLGTEPVTDPWPETGVAEAGELRVLRGGSWLNRGRSVRSAIRYRDVPGYRIDFIGFRLALGHSQIR